MAARSKKDTAIDESILEKIYYYHLWKDRLNWTKHAIPVRVKDSNSGFFIECYIYTVKKIEDVNMCVTVYDAYLPTKTIAEFEVPITNIYPTKRMLHTFEGSKVTILEDKFNPTSEVNDLELIFKRYPGMEFTYPEIKSILNTNSEAHKEFLQQSGSKFCLITGTVLPAYNKYKPLTITFDAVSIEKPANVANSLKDLYNQYKSCIACELGTQRTARSADNEPTFGRLCSQLQPNITLEKDIICFVGEAPGTIEEQTKIGFNPTAPAGEVLFKVISAAKIDINKCYFTNAVLCRPEPSSNKSQNGTPTVEHIKACNMRLKNELAIIKPRIVVLLGKTAYHAFFGKAPINVIGNLGWQNNSDVYLAAHPSFVLREISYTLPENVNKVKTEYLSHFIKVRERYNELVSKN